VTAKVVCFEGIDGSGKSTLLSAVAGTLELNGVAAVTLCAVSAVVLQGALRGYSDIRSSRLNVISADGCGDLAVVSAQVLAAVTALVRGDERVSARESRG